MKYIEIFESNDELQFNEVTRLFQINNISFNTLHEYRLFKELDHGETLGAAIVRVQRIDYVKANHLLISNGFKQELRTEQDPYSNHNQFTKFLNKIPLFKIFSGPTQIGLLLLALLFIVYSVFAISFINWQTKQFGDESWCVVQLVYNKRELTPNTEKIIVFPKNKCRETVRFYQDGTVILPGFDTGAAKGSWKEIDSNPNQIRIFDVNIFCEIYEGDYIIKKDFIRKNTNIRSDKTVIKLK